MTLNRRSRLAGVVILPITLGLSACDTAPGTENGNEPVAKSETPALRLPESVPVPEPELDRAALLSAVAQAASAQAAGDDDSDAQEKLAGRRFTLRIRFGCTAPDGPSARAMSWAYDEAEQRLTIRAHPDISAESPFLADMGDPVEAVEGFWIPRPWLFTDACPADAAAESGALPEPTVGIAQYFTAHDSRVQRRARRSYEIVRRAEPAIAPPALGFNLVLTGRLRSWPQSGVIRCQGRGPDARPVCIVSAELDRVSFEDPEDGLTVAEWSAG